MGSIPEPLRARTGGNPRAPPRAGTTGNFHNIKSLAPQQTFAHSLMDLTTSTLRCSCISKTCPIGHLIPIVASLFRNIRPGACRALPVYIYQMNIKTKKYSVTLCNKTRYDMM